MSVQSHYKYNSELHHFRMGEYKKTDDDKQSCIIEFVLFSIFSSALHLVDETPNSGSHNVYIIGIKITLFP